MPQASPFRCLGMLVPMPSHGPPEILMPLQNIAELYPNVAKRNMLLRYLCLFVCLSVWLSVCLPSCLPVCLAVSLSVNLSVGLLV